MIKLKLVDDTMGAEYLNTEINFNFNDLCWYRVIKERRAFSDKKYPDIVDFCIKGSERIFTARLNDFLEATK